MKKLLLGIGILFATAGANADTAQFRENDWPGVLAYKGRGFAIFYGGGKFNAFRCALACAAYDPKGQ